ncbi:MAG: sulfotransferase family 2 domain-containing protein [Bacteroidota bacterium]
MKLKVRGVVRGIKKEVSYQLSRPDPLLFDHLPKCGGTTINDYLAKSYPGRLTFALSDHRPERSTGAFTQLSQRERWRYQLIFGHHAHGIIDWVSPKMKRTTLFREPIDRIISHYYYVKRSEFHYLHEAVEKQNISLREYCQVGLSDELENWYVLHFSGLDKREVVAKPRHALDLAYETIRSKYDLIGFQDELPAFMEALKQMAGLSASFDNSRKNRTVTRPKVNEVDPMVLETIARYNALDIELFERLMALRAAGVLLRPD